jgi:pimeloyl-ACP methyl ester carboxylesterase
VVFTDDPDLRDVDSYGKETSLSNDQEDLQLFLKDFKAVKKPFRSALAQSIGIKDYSDEILLLKTNNIPLLVVFGADEKVIDCNYLDNAALPLWRNQIFKIPGASHLVQIDQPEAFNKLMKELITECFK